jgi:aryl-alcohol dehydrogenase-like predicted oxidoreductase
LYDEIIATAIVGTTKIRHLEDNIKASEITIDQSVKSEIDSILTDPEIFS